jgi:hypothetical protein
MCMTSQPLRTRPIGLPLRGSPVLSGESETFVVRSYFVPVDLRANWCSTCPAPAPHPRRNRRFFCIPKRLAASTFPVSTQNVSAFYCFHILPCFSRNTVPIGFCWGGFSSTAGYVPGNEAHFAMSDFCSPSWWFLAKKCCSFLSEQLGKSLSTFS